MYLLHARFLFLDCCGMQELHLAGYVLFDSGVKPADVFCTEGTTASWHCFARTHQGHTMCWCAPPPKSWQCLMLRGFTVPLFMPATLSLFASAQALEREKSRACRVRHHEHARAREHRQFLQIRFWLVDVTNDMWCVPYITMCVHTQKIFLFRELETRYIIIL